MTFDEWVESVKFYVSVGYDGIFIDDVRRAWDASAEIARAEILDCEGAVTLEDAKKLAKLWANGKLVGGDAHAVSVALIKEIDRLEASK